MTDRELMQQALETAFFFGVLCAIWFVFDYLWEFA